MRDRFSALIARFRHLAVLGMILAMSGYSLYSVMRHFGMPPVFAIGTSTCLDGAALIFADYSLRYIQDRMSGALPRILIYVFASVSAWMNSLHAFTGHWNRLTIPFWAGLPFTAVAIFEVHRRWERRKALSRAGKAYPLPLPSFGASTWILFPFSTLGFLRGIVMERRRVLAESLLREVIESPMPAIAESVAKHEMPSARVIPITGTRKAPKAGKRAWGRAHGWPDLPERGPLPRAVEIAFDAAHGGD